MAQYNAAQDFCPSNYHVTGKGLEVGVVGEMSTVICERVSEIAGVSDVERKKQGKYKISYQPTIKRRHRLHIKVKDKHIRGSPFTVMVLI